MRPYVLPLLVVCFLSQPATAQLQEFFDELLAPIEHTHFSSNGTPYAHPFTFEPPQIHQDVFFIHKYSRNTIEGSDENEAEVHIDWALTKRLGIVLAAPLIGIQEADGTHHADFGDLEIAPRVLLIDTGTFILSSNTFITVPTGDATRDLGSGETVISPFLTSWHDLGNWRTLLINVGPEFGVESGDASMTYSFSIIQSWVGTSILGGHDHPHNEDDGHDHETAQEHFQAGMTSLYLEFNGETELQDSERTFLEIMPGISYVLDPHAEVRFGVLIPVSRIRRYEAQYFTSFTWVY